MKIQHFNFRYLLIAILCLSCTSDGKSQESEVNEPRKIRLSLSYININNSSPRLLASVKTKVDRTYVSLSGVKVDFYFGDPEKDNYLGNLKTNESGEALFLVPETSHKVLDTTDVFLYTAVVENDSTIIDKESSVEVRRSKIDLAFITEDSVRKARFRILAPDSLGELTPVEGLAPVFYVKRLFGLLPISDNTVSTDDEGMCDIVFPNDLPGDSLGILHVIAKIDDDDTFGTIMAAKIIDWGIPQIKNNEAVSRELWSSRANAPLYLVFIVNFLLIGIGVTIVFILYNLYQIKTLKF